MSELDKTLATDDGLLTKIGQFFSSQARLSLFVLMLFTGLVAALAPIAWTYGRPVVSSAAVSESSATKGGATSTGNSNCHCNQVVVSFVSTATISQITQLLESLDVSIAFGPNENSSYELAVSANTADAVVQALNRAEALVVVATMSDPCL